jgi:hypothetical protein
MEQHQRLEDIVDAAVERLLGGEPVEAILASHPEHAADLARVLRSAELVVSLPAYDAAPAQRAQAMRLMLDQVEASALGHGAVGTGSGGGIMSILKSFRGRPLAFQGAAVAGALVLFGALGLGASAATGNAPEPVREFLGISNSTIRIELEGTIVTVEPSTSTLTVSASGDIRTVTVTGDTELSRGGDAIALGDFAAGQQVEVKGSLQPDNSILATRVHLEDGDDDDGRFPTAGPSTPGVDVPGAVPTFDDHDDDDDDFDDDSSGPGNADDDDFDDDNSGPGNGEDDDFDDDNSGHGSGDDDDDFDDSSRPGGGDDDDDHGDDNSGSGSGDDDDDSSGHGGGDDDRDD